MTKLPTDAVALAAVLDPWLPSLLRAAGYRVHTATSGMRARELAAQDPPDIVLLDPVLDDMSGTDACRLLRTEPGLARHLPILILLDGTPTPELRVAALRVGAWDFLAPSIGSAEILLKLATYIEAKRTVSEAVDDGLLDPSSGFCSLPGLARRARELAALMTRVNGPLACVVIEVGGRATIRDLGGVVARAARLSDVVGDLGANRMGVLAPGTNGPGAARLAKRIGEAIMDAVVSRTPASQAPPALTFIAGFDVVMNPKYAPVDPFDLMQRAAAAVHHGQASVDQPWVRRFVDTSADRRAPLMTAGSATQRPLDEGANT